MKNLLCYVVSLIIVVSLFYYGVLNKSNHIKNIEDKQQIQDDTTNNSIEHTIKSGLKIYNKDQILIKSNEFCSWNIKDNIAYGIYSKKHLLSKIILKNTEFEVKWITNKKVLLPGLVQTIDEKDTTICATTSNGREFYIVIVSGNDLKIVKKRNKTHYIGETHISNLEDFNKIFSY
jgi:hypothetical protein